MPVWFSSKNGSSDSMPGRRGKTIVLFFILLVSYYPHSPHLESTLARCTHEPCWPGKEPATEWRAGELGGKYFVQRLTLDLNGRTREEVAEAEAT